MRAIWYWKILNFIYFRSSKICKMVGRRNYTRTSISTYHSEI